MRHVVDDILSRTSPSVAYFDSRSRGTYLEADRRKHLGTNKIQDPRQIPSWNTPKWHSACQELSKGGRYTGLADEVTRTTG